MVCEREEQAIAAAKALKCDWQKPATPQLLNGSGGLFKYMRETTPKV